MRRSGPIQRWCGGTAAPPLEYQRFQPGKHFKKCPCSWPAPCDNSADSYPLLWSFAVMADIVLINPRFEVSYWGLEHALPFMGKRANLPVACLPLLAALTTEGHTVTLIDENVEAINFERVARADIVGVTGMSVQRFRAREILAELKERGCFTVMGGPWVTVQE